ncbi:MAG: LacI family transcriptional regulator, partial [Actinomycetia bacterium]|nr:LacI family transcriptional regulator [Actinomycetes bacterium]
AMPHARTEPTMADVAAAAGVSHQTVSRVLNNHPSVSSQTRRKVRDAIAGLGYRRNFAARALATGSSHILGVLVSNTTLSGPSGALLGIEQMARAHGYWVAMVGLRDRDADEVAEAIAHFASIRTDGIIAIAQSQAVVEATLAGRGTMPTVLVTSGAVPAPCPTVDVDQADGIRQLMTILRGLGHRRIAHIGGPIDDLHAAVRATAWRDCLPAGEPADELFVHGDWSSASGYRATMHLLGQPSVPTAICAANDRMAFGALRALTERGLSIPRDASVVGFDDIEGSDCSIPPLTTVRQNHDALGSAAMELLLEAMAGEPPRSCRVPAELVVRSSTGPAPI